MKHFSAVIYIFIAFTLTALAIPEGDEPSTLRRSVDMTSETTLFAKVKVSNGLIYVRKASDAQAFAGEFIFTERPPMVSYEVVGNEGRLTVKMSSQKKGKNEDYDLDWDSDENIELGDMYDNECHLDFSDRIPINLKMDLGLVQGNLDLGGLKLSDCDITTAVSQVKIDFSEPNLIEMKYMDIECGVGKFRLENLGNANFSTLNFDAGVGSYELDFSGRLHRNADVDLEIGMGKLVVYLPRNIGVRMRVDKSFLCSFDIDDVYKQDDTYTNDNWGKVAANLDMRIDAGVAKVRVEWVD